MKLRDDYSASELRRLARASKDVRQSSRLLSIAAVPDGMNRTDAARIGGMDRQTLRDWCTGSIPQAPTVLSISGLLIRCRGCRQSSRANWLRWLRRGRTVPLTAWCAGGAST